MLPMNLFASKGSNSMIGLLASKAKRQKKKERKNKILKNQYQ
jgi:hypothetical protein